MMTDTLESTDAPTFPPWRERLHRVESWLQREGAGYRLTRFMLLRATGLVYFVAFLSLAQQGLALIGHNGLLPADLMVQRVVEYHGSPWKPFWEMPSLFWFQCSDATILAVTWTGTVLSFLVLCGFANSLIMVVLWALYLSLLPIGQEWLGYGWDIQILETGFLGIMLAPLLDLRPFPRHAPPVIIIWLYRWLIFRIMLGAGLIKLRGDSCWRDLTALYYHYETQPIPNPLSRLLHFAPQWFHQAGVAWNHFVEVIVPWFGFIGRWPRHIAGALILSFQLILLATGNLSFLNWLTIIPCLACFDDSFWRRVLPRFIVARSDAAAKGDTGCQPVSEPLGNGDALESSKAPEHGLAARFTFPLPRAQLLVSIAYTSIVAWLSIGPVSNLISSQQAMNTSFDTLHLVNTYGAFGSIDRERFELVFEGSNDFSDGPLTIWREYDFKAKPGNPQHRPVIITPYHYRLDWAAWFPWSQIPGRNAWVPHFIWNLLHNDPGTLSLLAGNPFPTDPPRLIRVVVYRYKYAPLGNAEGVWWSRQKLGVHIPALSLESEQLLNIVRQSGWPNSSP